MDIFLFWDEYCLVRHCVIHWGRALPVCWRVFKHKSASLVFSNYRKMLLQAAKRLPNGIKIVLLADRGFAHTQLMRMATQQLGWHYRIRVKSDTWIWRVGKGWCQLKDFYCPQGSALCFHSVRIHKTERYGMVNMIMGCNNVNGEFWAIVSDEKTNLQTFQEYGMRFDIGENFWDDQSSGWNLQRSEIRDVPALSRLCFILAIETLYVTAQGVELVESGNVEGGKIWLPSPVLGEGLGERAKGWHPTFNST